MKKLEVEVTSPNSKRTIWRDGKAYRQVRYAGALRTVKAINPDTGKQWTKED